MEVRYNCPFCSKRVGSADRSAHLYYNTESKLWFCFKCHAKGKGKPKGTEMSPRIQYHADKIEWGLPKDAEELSSFLDEFNPVFNPGIVTNAAIDYLIAHHVDPNKAAYKYHLMIEGEWMIFPVYHQGKLIYFQKRHVFRKEFMNPPIESKPLFWVGSHLLNTVVIVESYMNAIRLAPMTQAVCIFGKYLKEQHAEEIISRVKRVVVCLDAGEIALALKIKRLLCEMGCYRVDLAVLDEGDVCDMNDKQVFNLLSPFADVEYH